MVPVADDTPFGVLIQSDYGFNLTDPDSIRFTIDDGVHFVYQRDLGSDAVRVIDVAGEDPQKTIFWVVYERSLETVLPGGLGWMVPGSRANHFANSPPLVEIQVYHFSAAQGGVVVASSGTTRDNDQSSRSGTVAVVKCFIDTAAYEVKPAFGLLALLWVIGMVGLLPIVFAVRVLRRKRLPDCHVEPNK
jgi:hypothetical protein